MHATRRRRQQIERAILPYFNENIDRFDGVI